MALENAFGDVKSEHIIDSAIFVDFFLVNEKVIVEYNGTAH